MTERILKRWTGKDVPGAPYDCGTGHFEINLHGQTVGAFLMGSCTVLLWKDDRIHTYMTYADIHDEPFDVYPVVEGAK